MPNRRAASAMGASPTWASQPTRANRRRRRRLVSRPGRAARLGRVRSSDAPAPAPGAAASAGAGGRARSQRAEPGHQLLAEGGRLHDRGVVEEAEHPGADGGERRHPEHQLDRPVVEAGAPPCPGPTSSATRRASSASTRIRISTRSSPSTSHGSSGRAASTSTSSGTTASPASPARHLALDAVHPERAHGRAVEVPGHQVPVAEAEPQADRAPRGAPRPGR